MDCSCINVNIGSKYILVLTENVELGRFILNISQVNNGKCMLKKQMNK